MNNIKNKILFSAVLIGVFSLFLYSETRIKTVEFNFGGYYNSTDLSSDSKYTFPTRTVKIPENGVTIRSAWVEYMGMNTSKTNVVPLVLYFDAGTSATTAVFTSGQYTVRSGESIILFARGDVTSVIQSQLANLKNGVNFTAGVRITGPSSNMHTMKLYITYEYDDTSPVQLKTVRFPLYSDWVSKVASYNSDLTAGTYSMYYEAYIPDLLNVKQQWVEIRGFHQNSNGDSSIYVNIDNNTNEPTMTIDDALSDSYMFRYLSNSNVVAGFSTGAVQSVNITHSNGIMSHLGGEVVVTYEANNSASTKINTVRYFLGQGTNGDVITNFSLPLYLREEGITIKELYARIMGSFDSATAVYITYDGSVNGNSIPQQSVYTRTSAAQISGYERFYSFTSQASNWTNGSNVSLTIGANSSAGAYGAELIVTYEYNNDAAHTTSYSVYGGNSTVGNSSPYSYTANAYWVESGSSKTLTDAYVYVNIINNSTTQDFTTTVDFNSNSPLTTQHRSITEDTTITRLYQNKSQLPVGSSSFTINYSISTNRGAFGSKARINYLYVPPPKNPEILKQTKLDGSVISNGGWVNSSTIRFEGVLSSSMNVDTLALAVEVKPISSSFDGTNLSTGPSFSYNQVAQSTYVVVSGLTSGTQYKWRARAVGDGGASNWVDYGIIPAFGVDLSSPPAPAMISITPVDTSSQNYTSVNFSFESVSDIDGSGVKNYEIILATSTDFTNIVFSSMPAGTSAYVSGLGENVYYWKVRAYDNAGNIGLWSSTRSFIVDLTTPTVVDNQSGDDVWRNANDGVYDVDFNDSGNSLLNRFQIKATTGPNQTGTILFDWTDLITDINSNSYTSNWQITQSMWDLLKEGTNYINVRVYDNAENYYVENDVFYVLKDTTLPSFPSNLSPSDGFISNVYSHTFNWSNSSDFSSGVDNYEFEISTDEYFNVFTASGSYSSTSANITLPSEGVYYWHVRAKDKAGNYSAWSSTFSIIIDTTPPTYTNGEAGGDNVWRNTSVNYNVDFFDSLSKLSDVKYEVWTLPNRSGENRVPKTSIAGVYGLTSYTTDWPVDFNSLKDETTNYVSIEIYDIAGNTTTIIDAFKILKDTTPPTIADNQTGDDLWRNVSVSYDVDFNDNGSGLNGAKYEVWSEINKTGIQIIPLTDITPSVSGSNYATNWQIDFNSLNSGTTNYVSVEVYDVAGNTSTLTDVFYVKKDTVSPYIAISTPTAGYEYQDDPGAVIDIDFFDDISGLDYFEYKITTGTNQTGTVVKNWTLIGYGNGNVSYTANWGIDFNALPINVLTYISVRVYDKAGNVYEYSDATTFKRLAPPGAAIIDNQEGDDIWRNGDSGVYDIDFVHYGGVDITSFGVTAYTLPNKSGTMLSDYVKVADVNATSYTADWNLPAAFWDLLVSGTNYISVKVWDVNGSITELVDAFYVLKDTENPSGNIDSPLYINNKTFDLYYSTYDSYSGGNYVKIYYTYDTYEPYTWYLWGSTWVLSPVNFTSTQWGNVGFRLIIYDKAGNIDELYDPPLTSTAPEFYTLVDATYPAVIDNQDGDYTWYNAGGQLFNVDFSANGGSPLDWAQYRVYSSTGGGGNIIKDWTYIATNINNTNYTTNWTVDFNSLVSGINYVAVRVQNKAGNLTEQNDVFFVKKDTVTPYSVDNQSGVDVWVSSSGYYDVDFYDDHSGLDKFQIKATTGPNQTGTLLFDWSDVITNISSTSYTDNWRIPNALFNLLQQGTNYISVKVYDNMGYVYVSTDVFYVKKDTTPPNITDNQNGDDVWRNTNNGYYDVDFYDSHSGLDKFQIKATTGPNQTGTLLFNWSDVITNINSTSYTNNWQIPSYLWGLLGDGTNYISIRVYDNSGNYRDLIDAFYVRKDLTSPVIVDNQIGDDIWRSTNNAVYNVDFQDNISLKGFEIKITTDTNQGGTLVVDWTPVISDINSNSYYTDWGMPYNIWVLMPEGYNYVSVRSSDVAGNYSYLTDAFYIKKDTSVPVITDNQNGDDVWRNTNSGIYDVDFYDEYSGLNKFQIKATTGPNQTGILLFDWSDIVVNINQNNYANNWQIPSTLFNLLSNGTNYISIRVYDRVNIYSDLTDAFYIRKDTDNPSAITNLYAQTASQEAEIAITFNAPSDNTSGLSHYIVKYATFTIDATNFDSASTFSQSWVARNDGGIESYNIKVDLASTLYYVAVKSVDKAGNVSDISNVVSAVSGADTTPPAVISDLTAETGAFPGEIHLTWTATGDNVNVGTATAYELRWRDDGDITSQTLWNTATVYYQTWTPKVSGSSESYVVSGFMPGTTYYFAIRAIDEANNVSGISNSTSAWAQVYGARNGLFIYQDGINNTPYYKKWTPPDFSSELTLPPSDALGTSAIRHVIVRPSPIRKEAMAGVLSSDGVLQIYRYDYDSGFWSKQWSTTTITATNSAYRGFDIAYEQESGKCMVLYNGASAGELYYNIYDGNRWTGALSITTGTANASLWVRLEPRPKSNEILAVFSRQTSLELYAMIWDGSKWTAGQQIRNGVGITNKQDWDIAWETFSGRALVVYNANNTGRADTYLWDGTSWNQVTSSYYTFGGNNNTAHWIRLASDPSSNYIGVTSVDSGNDWNANVWDGSGWNFAAVEDGFIRNNSNQARTIDCIWESKSSKFIVVGGESSQVKYAYWTSASGWSSNLSVAPYLAGWSRTIKYTGLENDKNTNSIILWAHSAANELRTAEWNGTRFVFNPTTPHATNVQEDYMPSMIATDRYDEIPPHIIDGQTGDDTWRNSNSGFYNVDATDDGGSHLKGIQTLIYTGPNQSGSLVEDWTYQVILDTSSNYVDSYTDDWQISTQTWNNLPEGINYVSVRAVDRTSNTSQLIVDAFYIKKDTTSPTDVILNIPANNSYVNTQQVYFDWGDSYDATSGINYYLIEVSTDEYFGSTSYTEQVTVSQATSTALSSGKYFWRVKAYDNAGNYSAWSSTYSVIVDTTIPSITDNQTGDDTWYNLDPGNIFDVDFGDDVNIDKIQYTAYSGANLSGVKLIDWTDIVPPPVNLTSYTNNWGINFSLLNQGTNYISVRVYDSAGNVTGLNDVFYVKKDTRTPTVVDNQDGDDVWRAINDGVYDVDFFDNESLLKDVEIKITTAPDFGGTVVVDWMPILTAINADAYTSNWSLPGGIWGLMPEGTNYVSVRVYDNALNIYISTDVFYVRKDTTSPVEVSLNVPADNSYVNSAEVYFDWSDSYDGTSGIDYYEIQVSTDEYFNYVEYSNQTTVSEATSTALGGGIYYWRVRVKDKANNYSNWSSTYSFRLDLNAPSITNNQVGDDNWYNSDPGNIFDVDFGDDVNIDKIQYTAYSGANLSGVKLIDWTDIVPPPVNLTSYTNNWGINFSLFGQGTNYISVRVYDSAGNVTGLNDVFYVKKDTRTPTVVDNQDGDDVWRAINDGVYDVDFFDNESLLKDVEIKITTAPDFGGTLVTDWTPILTAINADAYTSNWSLPYEVWDLMPLGTNYVSVRVSDNVGNITISTDVFYVKKDTNPVSIVDNQTGDDVWRNTNNGVYDIDAHSPNSPIDKFQVRIGTLPAFEGIFITTWVDVSTGIALNDFTTDWSLPDSVFDAMISGVTNYVSVKFFNEAGLYNIAMDVFYVLKDTVNPPVPLLDTPLDNSATNTLTVNFNWYQSDDLESGVESYDFIISTDEYFNVFEVSGTYTSNSINVNLSGENKYYWKVRAKDRANNYSSWSSTYSVIVDTTLPSITDNQTGDDVWRNINDGIYDVDFNDNGGSLLSKFQIRASTNTGTAGPFSFDWSNVVTNINLNSYTSNWQITNTLFDLLNEGTNYISVRVYDNAGNVYTYPTQPFYILKDTTAPSIPVLTLPLDNSATNTLTVNFIWNSADLTSGIENYDFIISTDEYFNVFEVSGTYTSNSINVNLSGENKYYWKVRAKDRANNYSLWSSTYSVIVDTTLPSITDNQNGDDVWRNINDGVYDVDFNDNGGSLIDKFQIKATAGPNQTGTVLFDWSDLITGINSNSYTSNWQLTQTLWDLLNSGTNYISIRVYDNASNYTELTDAFYVKKDTEIPQITDNQTGDDNWYNSDPGNIFDIDFNDFYSGLSSATYMVYDSPGKSGNIVIPETAIVNGPVNSYTANWGVDFNNLKEGKNYVTVMAYDIAGNTTEYVDVFYVKKDTSAPVITDNQTGIDTWYNSNPGNIFDVDFYDYGIGITTIAYNAYTQTGESGTLLINQATIYADVAISAFTDNWGISDSEWNLLKQGTNYITVYAYDGLSNSSKVVDAFYILKDTTPPDSVTDLTATTPTLAEDEGKIFLNWSAVGDDGLIGSASYYMIRYRDDAPVDNTNWDTSNVYTSTITPKLSGQSESLVMDGLVAGNTYYIAIKVVDKAGNVSGISNSASAYAGVDKTPPAAVNDLSGEQGDFTGQIKLSWTARGEGTRGVEGTGTATSYIVKYTSGVWVSFDDASNSTYSQSWVPLLPGQVENRIMEGLLPGTTYSIAIKIVDEVGNVSNVSNVIIATATPAGAADGMIIYGGSGSNDLKYRTWVPITWSAQYGNGINISANVRWSKIKSVPIVANAKIAGVLYSDNSLHFYKYDGLTGSWSDITPSPAPNPAGSATRRFDIEVENNTGRVMVVYYDSTLGSVKYAVYSATASAWVVPPTSLQMNSLTGNINWVRIKSMPSTNRIGLAVLDSNSDISAAIWNGNSWVDNVNLTLSASINTEEAFDLAWESLTGDLLVLWGSGTSTQYRKWYSSSGWGTVQSGPAIGGTANWIRLCSSPLSNRIGFTVIDSGNDWNVSVWRSNGSEGWSALPAEDAGMSGNASRITDCAWQSKTEQLLIVAVDNIGTFDNKFDWITWNNGTWSNTPSVAPPNNNTAFTGNIYWIGLIPDPNTDNIMAYGIDSAGVIKTTLWSGAAWADATSSANFLHTANSQEYLYDSVSIDFDRHDNIPPTAIDNQTGDDTWRNSNTGLYNIGATDSGGSHISRIQTKIHSVPNGGGTLIEDWTDQITGINLDSYSTPWGINNNTFNLLPEGQSYVWVRVLDGVGNVSNILVDAFYIKKDTTPPVIVNNMPADFSNIWTSTGVGKIDIDFSDSGNSGISSMTYTVYTSTNQTGTLVADNVLIASGTIGNIYLTDWDIDFNLLAHGTNYISVTVWDNASSSTTLVDAFKVLKDTQTPGSVTDLIASPGPLRGSVKLSWTAPGDDGSINDNIQGGYIVKYATYPITTDSLFNSASTYAQNWIPQSAGSSENNIVYGLEVGTTYYFAIKVYDKANNKSSISNLASSLPQTANIFINEVYPGGSPGNDWIELYNNTANNFNLNGWKIIYKQGALDTSAAEVDVWTGTASDVIVSSGILKIDITSLDLSAADSYSVKLVNSEGKVVDRVQWPVMSANDSYSRIYDGYDYFEIDPTPTPGYLNSVSTKSVKLSEISYNSNWQFIELFNKGTSTLTLTNYSLRNSNGQIFKFTRIIYPNSYILIDSSTISNDLLSWWNAFGISGLNPDGDYLVLEDENGQVIDRVLWQGTNYTLRDYYSNLVAAGDFAPANVNTSIIRINGEGSDTDSDSYDFGPSSVITPFTRNTDYGQLSDNNLIYPSQNGIIPYNFSIKLKLSQDFSSGNNDIIAFVRTGGIDDGNSPHVFRLSDIGIDLTSLSEQTTYYNFDNFTDIDGNKLLNNAVYKVIFTVDSDTTSSRYIEVDNVKVDTSVHSIEVSTTNSKWFNENAEDDVIKLKITNNSSNYDLILSSINIGFYQSDGITPLTVTELSNLINYVRIYKDSVLGVKDVYEQGVDIDMISEIDSSQFVLNGSTLSVSVDTTDVNSVIHSLNTETYFVVVVASSNASLQSPNSIIVKLNPETVQISDSYTYASQKKYYNSQVQTSTITFIRPASAPAGTNWPYNANDLFVVQTMCDIYIGASWTDSRVYLSGRDGVFRALDYNGIERWSFSTENLAPIKTSPLVREEGGNVYLYFITDNGILYKLQDLGNTYSLVWYTTIGANITSNIIDSDTSIYFGTDNSRIYCLNKTNGAVCNGWTFDSGIDANVTGTISIDYRLDVNLGWAGLSNGKVVAFSLADGSLVNQFITGGPVYASPYVDSAYSYASNNMFIASTDGKLYSRVASNLTVVPSNWQDFSASTSVYTSPWKMIYDDWVFVGDDSGRLYKVSSSSGVLASGWPFVADAPIRTSPVVYNGYVYFSAGEYLYAVDVNTAQLRSGFPVYTGGFIRSDFVIDSASTPNVIIFSSDDGKTYMIEI